MVPYAVRGGAAVSCSQLSPDNSPGITADKIPQFCEPERLLLTKPS